MTRSPLNPACGEPSLASGAEDFQWRAHHDAPVAETPGQPHRIEVLQHLDGEVAPDAGTDHGRSPRRSVRPGSSFARSTATCAREAECARMEVAIVGHSNELAAADASLEEGEQGRLVDAQGGRHFAHHRRSRGEGADFRRDGPPESSVFATQLRSVVRLPHRLAVPDDATLSNQRAQRRQREATRGALRNHRAQSALVRADVVEVSGVPFAKRARQGRAHLSPAMFRKPHRASPGRTSINPDSWKRAAACTGSRLRAAVNSARSMPSGLHSSTDSRALASSRVSSAPRAVRRAGRARPRAGEKGRSRGRRPTCDVRTGP